MQALIHSFLLVAVSEMGDKTQLLALVLAARYRQPWTIMAGILIATVVNHVLAASFGVWLSTFISAELLRWVLAATFLIFAVWLLFPDKDEGLPNQARGNVLLTTVVVFFLAEMGDKTQLATVALAASLQSVIWVTVGTTLGMLFSDGLAVFFGNRLLARLSMVWVRRIAAFLFFLFAVFVLFARRAPV